MANASQEMDYLRQVNLVLSKMGQAQVPEHLGLQDGTIWAAIEAQLTPEEYIAGRQWQRVLRIADRRA